MLLTSRFGVNNYLTTVGDPSKFRRSWPLIWWQMERASSSFSDHCRNLSTTWAFVVPAHFDLIEFEISSIKIAWLKPLTWPIVPFDSSFSEYLFICFVILQQLLGFHWILSFKFIRKFGSWIEQTGMEKYCLKNVRNWLSSSSDKSSFRIFMRHSKASLQSERSTRDLVHHVPPSLHKEKKTNIWMHEGRIKLSWTLHL